MAAAQGDNVRVGLEDSLWDGPCQLAQSNADQVRRVRGILEGLGLSVATADEAPEPPDNPMSADRVRWEHIQRVYELCDHNVSETARRLGMHRRTLQRILAKRAPR